MENPVKYYSNKFEKIFLKIKNNKVLKSFLKFVLLTALIHIGILVYRTIKEGNIKLLNYFSILDLNALFPRIIKGWWSDVISLMVMGIIFSSFLTYSLLHKRANELYLRFVLTRVIYLNNQA